jgi:hypothetical protein
MVMALTTSAAGEERVSASWYGNELRGDLVATLGDPSVEYDPNQNGENAYSNTRYEHIQHRALDLDELRSLDIPITELSAAEMRGGGHTAGAHHSHGNNKDQRSHPIFPRRRVSDATLNAW